MANVSSSNSLNRNVPKLRFPEFDEEWKSFVLSDFTNRIMRKNKDNLTTLPLTISSKDGLVNQVSYFNKQVSSKDMSGYFLLKNGEFAYNKSYSVGYDFGSIKRLERYPMGALSTLYICFELTRFNSDFIKVYFDSLKWYKEIYMIAAEGARNHGLLNVPTDEFFSTKHILPPSEEEQSKIAKFLLLLDERIAKQQKLVDALKSYKRGLLFAIFDETSGLYDKKNWNLKQVVDLLNYEQPQKYIVSNENYSNEFETPVLTANKAFILGFTNEREGIYKKGDVVIYDDFTMEMKYVTFPFKVKSSTIKLLTSSKGINLRFMFYLLQAKDLHPEGHQRSYISKVEKMQVLIPSLEEQNYISNQIENLDYILQHNESILDKLSRFKQALLQQMFI